MIKSAAPYKHTFTSYNYTTLPTRAFHPQAGATQPHIRYPPCVTDQDLILSRPRRT